LPDWKIFKLEKEKFELDIFGQELNIATEMPPHLLFVPLL